MIVGYEITRYRNDYARTVFANVLTYRGMVSGASNQIHEHVRSLIRSSPQEVSPDASNDVADSIGDRVFSPAEHEI